MNSALTLDIPLARKVLEHLIAHPEEHDQSEFGVRSDCGTTACIAGTVVLMDLDSLPKWRIGTHGGVKMYSVLVDGERIGIDDRAADLLGLDGADAVRLFYTFDEDVALKILGSYIVQAEAQQATA